MDRLGVDLKFTLWTMDPSGGDLRPVSGKLAALPKGSAGQPGWHPGGRWLVFQVHDPALKPIPGVGPAAQSHMTGPGGGVNNDLWLAEADGTRAWRLTDVGDWGGALHPHFSHDGKRLVWSALRPGNGWSIAFAEFTPPAGDTPPRLGRVEHRTPGNMAFYEVHGFSPDDREVLYCATPAKADYWKLDIFAMDAASGSARRLTRDEEWDEHAHFSPDGEWIVWTTTRGIEQPRSGMTPTTEYWAMRRDGGSASRLTRFNRKGSPEHLDGRRALPSDFDFSPDGDRIAAYVQSFGSPGQAYRQDLVLLRIEWPAAGGR
ncbi:MAG: hypothetical protein SF028_12150 [Candidatus Sumerlaeia bacterium]|nr:hypothetical protein [Candidatus Sumerlaeia bacterium]